MSNRYTLKMSVAIVALLLCTGFGFTTQSAIQTEDRLAATCECGVANIGRRIVGGTEVPVDAFPWQVALIRNFYNYGRYTRYLFCGATLITSNYVLTAAHCFIDSKIPPQEVILSLGDHDLSTTSETPSIVRYIAQLITHPQYRSSNHDFDLALIRMNQPVIFSQYIRPICMPEPNFNTTGRTVTVSGWGLTQEGATNTVPRLRDVQVSIIPTKECNASTSYDGSVTKNQLCAGVKTGGKDSCQGDSGGPLVYKCETRHIIVGIVSSGIGCARAAFPGIYTNVMVFLSYINSCIGTDKTCTATCTT